MPDLQPPPAVAGAGAGAAGATAVDANTPGHVHGNRSRGPGGLRAEAAGGAGGVGGGEGLGGKNLGGGMLFKSRMTPAQMLKGVAPAAAPAERSSGSGLDSTPLTNAGAPAERSSGSGQGSGSSLLSLSSGSGQDSSGLGKRESVEGADGERESVPTKEHGVRASSIGAVAGACEESVEAISGGCGPGRAQVGSIDGLGSGSSLLSLSSHPTLVDAVGIEDLDDDFSVTGDLYEGFSLVLGFSFGVLSC